MLDRPKEVHLVAQKAAQKAASGVRSPEYVGSAVRTSPILARRSLDPGTAVDKGLLVLPRSSEPPLFSCTWLLSEQRRGRPRAMPVPR